MSKTSFCWWCGQPRLVMKHIEPDDTIEYFSAMIHDGQEVTVHKKCKPYAEEWVRMSRMTAADAEYYQLHQSHQIARVDMKMSDPRRGKKGTDAKDN